MCIKECINSIYLKKQITQTHIHTRTYILTHKYTHTLLLPHMKFNPSHHKMIAVYINLQIGPLHCSNMKIYYVCSCKIQVRAFYPRICIPSSKFCSPYVHIKWFMLDCRTLVWEKLYQNCSKLIASLSQHNREIIS